MDKRNSMSWTKRGAALVIVLAFVVLLTGVVLAMLTASLNNLQVAENNAEQIKVDLFAQGATEFILGDLSQEILDGSSPPATFADGSKLYLPSSGAKMIPQRVGTDDALPNLVKRSQSGAAFYTGGVVRAAAVPTSAPSLNGRSLSTERWNKACLLPKATTTSDTDITPVFQFVVPDWILVARDGSNPTSLSPANKAKGSNPVLGRFAYAIYDEGGLLDANVAGYPSTSSTAQKASKAGLGYADLSRIFVQANFTQAEADKIVDRLLQWRNYATLQPDQSFPQTTFTFGFNSGTIYYNYILSNLKGFLTVANTALFNGQSDRQFSSRQELEKFLLQGISTNALDRAKMQVALQYLATFTRDLNQPSHVPLSGRPKVLAANLGGNNAAGLNLDDKINPNFLSTRVGVSFTRNDGTQAVVGEPLVKKRFSLNRLAWLTWEGPSANGASNATKAALLNAGIPQALIDQGTDSNIKKYFGLTWDAPNKRWKYNVHNGSGNGPSGSIVRLGTLGAGSSVREPDFFELLKASIHAGSLGKAAFISDTAVSPSNTPAGYAQAEVPANYTYARDTSIDYQIIQIGANIIDQFDPDSLPSRIVFDDGSLPAQEFSGIENLPYLAYFVNGMLRVEAPSTPPTNIGGGTKQYPQSDPGPLAGSPGAGIILQIPALWNPHDVSGSRGSPRPLNFRVVADSADPITVASGGTAGYRKIYTSSVGYDGSNAQFSYNATSTSLQPANPSFPVDYSMAGRVLNQSNTVLTFSDSNGTLFREPTLLLRKGGAINLQSPAYPGGIQSIDLSPVKYASDAVGTSFLGFVLGTFPLRFDVTSGGTPKTISAGAGFLGVSGVPSQSLVYLTYRVQYEDPASSGKWITYDTKYGRATNGRADFNWNLSVSNTNAPTIISAPDDYIPWNWASTIDPRTSRFGMIFGAMSAGVSSPYPYSPAYSGWISDVGATVVDPLKGITFSLRPDNYGGHYFVDFYHSVNPSNPNASGGAGSLSGTDAPMADSFFPQHAAGWSQSIVHGYWGNSRYSFSPGMLSQNNTSAPFYIRRDAADNPGTANDEFGKQTGNPQPSYYADPDGVVRRAMGAFVSAGVSSSLQSAISPIGLPLAITQKSSAVSSAIVTDPAQNLNQAQSRPLILNRPFQSPAELGYVFRDTPWKNVDFFTPESGDGALLDVFCVSDADNAQGLRGGRVNLNTRQTVVLASIISGAGVDDSKVSDATVGAVSPDLSSVVANALVARTSDTTTLGFGPLTNITDLVGKWVSDQPITASTSYVPSNAGGDLILADGYKDGKKSYLGFSDGQSGANPAKDLSSAYGAATFSSPALKTSMAQIERFRAAPIRALTSVGQTRVWDLMIDIVAQTGVYSGGSNSLADFMVEGEQRYWVHVAIDRLTGRIIDKQIEVVKE